MIQLWKDRLKPLGFRKEGSRIYKRRCGEVIQVVREGRSRQLPNHVQVVLTIAVENSFSEERNELPVLSADLHEADEPTEEDFGIGRWWTEKDSELALASFLRFGMPRFEKYCDLRNLRHYFEFILEHGIPVSRFVLPTFLTKMATGENRPPAVRIPPIYRKFVALICVLQGDTKTATRYAREYLESIPPTDDLTWQRERREILKQINQLAAGVEQ